MLVLISLVVCICFCIVLFYKCWCIYYRSPLFASSLFLKGGVKDGSSYMLNIYREFGQEMKSLIYNPLRVDINDHFYYLIRFRWWWICDAKAKHPLIGCRDVSAKYALLPQVCFYNLLFNGAAVYFICLDTLELLLNVRLVFTPKEYRQKKRLNQLPNEPFGVLLDNDLNQYWIDKVESFVGRDPYLTNLSFEEQKKVRIWKADDLRQPQYMQPLPFSLHPILPSLHMIKTVFNHSDHQDINFIIFHSEVGVEVIQELLLQHLVDDCIVSKKFETWKNAHYNAKTGRVVGYQKFTFGNLNKRQSHDLFKNMIKWLVDVDKKSNKESVHFYVGWSLAFRIRVAECVKIYMKRYFRQQSDKDLLIRCQQLNKIILRLVLTFYPQNV